MAKSPPSVSSASDLKGNSSTTPATLVVLAFAAVYVIWGSTYLGIRIAIESIPPFFMAGIRHLTVGLILFPILVRKTGVRPTAANWRAAAISGIMLLFFGNGGLSWAEQLVPSGISALLVATVALWLVVVDWLRPGGTRPVPRVIAGLILGFAGMVLLVGPARLGGSARINLVGAGVLGFASFVWACGSLYSKYSDMPSSPMLGVAMQSLAASGLLLLAGFVTGEYHDFHFAAITMRSWLALLYLIVFGSGIGFTAYVYILNKSTAAKVSTYAFVNPVVAIFLGWLVLAEPLTLRTMLAAAIILSAVLLVITAPKKEFKPVCEPPVLTAET